MNESLETTVARFKKSFPLQYPEGIMANRSKPVKKNRAEDLLDNPQEEWQKELSQKCQEEIDGKKCSKCARNRIRRKYAAMIQKRLG